MVTFCEARHYMKNASRYYLSQWCQGSPACLDSKGQRRGVVDAT